MLFRSKAFRNCPELQTVVFRENDTPLLSIGPNAFENAVKLTSLTFAESLKTINYGAFSGCTALESVAFPDSLTMIYGTGNYDRKGAFENCTALLHVKFGIRLTTLGSDTDSHGVFENCLNLEDVTFEGNLITIGKRAFYGCEALKTLEFPDSLQTIGDYGFYNNIRLTRVAFGTDIKRIGKSAFMGCVSLKTVYFPASTTPLLTIDTSAFKNCVQLASLTLSDALTTLGSGAFSGCTMLRKMTVPSIISKVSDGVFAGMSNLKEVTFLGLPPENLANAGLASDVTIRYSSEYAEEWEEIIANCGFTNAKPYNAGSGAVVLPAEDSRYELSTDPSDRSIASVTVNDDSAIDSFVLTDGKVYDSVLRIVNTANRDVTLTLPTGYAYETFEGANPLTIPANSRNILTITRTAVNTFLVSREKLKVLE